MPQRSTSLELLSRCCPRALDYQEARVERDRRGFATGVAAHAVLQHLAEHPDASEEERMAMARAVAQELATRGRSFDGTPEPPLPVDACLEGRDLAWGWLEAHGSPADPYVELGVAVDKDWNRVDYKAPSAYYRAIFDLLWREVEEDGEERRVVAVARDFKSAWVASEEDLDSVQMRGQAILASKMWAWDELDAIRIEIASLRTRRLFTRTIWLDDDGQRLLEGWQKDLDVAIAAAEFRLEDGQRPAAPGAGCQGCPYLLRCEPARAWMRGSVLEVLDDDDEDSQRRAVGTRLAIAEAMVQELREHARMLTAERSIEIAGGTVGYREQERREPVADVHRAIAHAWHDIKPEESHSFDSVNGDWLGLLLALDVGVSSCDAFAKAKVPGQRGDPTWRARREQLELELVTTKTTSKFGIHRSQEG